ncbi:MAG: hypothetical protein KDH20_02690 [Rhodocyclaceae bacterium]|nr:hypothetical protein [Rhodocyclaceae bacterium]
MNEHAPALEVTPDLTVPADLAPALSAGSDAARNGDRPAPDETIAPPAEPSRRRTPARHRKREAQARQARQAAEAEARANAISPTEAAPLTETVADASPADLSEAAVVEAEPLPTPAETAILARVDVVSDSDRAIDLCAFDGVLVASDLALPAGISAERLPDTLDALDERLRAAGTGHLVIVVPGDPLATGPGRALLSALGPDQVRLHAGVSDLQTALGRIGFAVEDVTTLRVERLGREGVSARLRRGRLYAIDPTPLDPQSVGQLLEDAGLHQARVWVVSPTPEAPVSAMMAFELTDAPNDFPPGSQVVAYTIGADGSCRDWPGIPATEIPGALPEAARLLALAWLQPGSEECGWCIEGPQPALALDWARERPEAAVYCIGCDEATLATALVRHGAGEHAEAVSGGSFHSLEPLADPNVVFIRAGEEFTQQVRTAWTRLRPGGRMVVVAEGEAARLELMQFAHRTPPGLWQDLSVAAGDAEARPIRLSAPTSVRLMGWTKPPRG